MRYAQQELTGSTNDRANQQVKGQTAQIQEYPNRVMDTLRLLMQIYTGDYSTTRDRVPWGLLTVPPGAGLQGRGNIVQGLCASLSRDGTLSYKLPWCSKTCKNFIISLIITLHYLGTLKLSCNMMTTLFPGQQLQRCIISFLLFLQCLGFTWHQNRKKCQSLLKNKT